MTLTEYQNNPYIKLTKSMRNITGKVFGRLTAIQPSRVNRHSKVMWLCRCTCGETTEVVGANLSSGLVQSCGCLREEVAAAKQRKYKHNTSGLHHRLYHQWHDMMTRCYHPTLDKHKHYEHVSVCLSWHDWDNYAEFALANGYTDELTIDRLDVLDDYRPDNVQFVTREENSRRGNRDGHIKRLEAELHHDTSSVK